MEKNIELLKFNVQYLFFNVYIYTIRSHIEIKQFRILMLERRLLLQTIVYLFHHNIYFSNLIFKL